MKNSNNFTPVAVYPNAHLQEKFILQENKGRSGVYRWVNLINGKSYIGSSVDLKNRLRQYYSNSYLNSQKKKSNISKALVKYGYSKFKLEILIYCSPAKCLKWEQLFLDLLKPEYNILKIAGSLWGYKHTDQSLAKMRAWKHSAFTRANMSGENHPFFGKPRAEETKAKMSASMMGNSNGKIQPNSIKIVVTDLELDTKTTYNSICAAAKALNIHPGRISEYFNRNQIKPYKGRYVFSRK